MRIVRSYNKPNLIQVAKLHQIIGDDQMPYMYGIERTEEKSYFFGR